MIDLSSDRVHCWIVPAAAVSDDELMAASCVLSEVERDRAVTFRFDRDRRLYVTAHTAVRLLISQYTGCRPESLPIIVDAMGRPALAAGFSRLHFSLSHSAQMAAVALAVDDPVGIDVEQIHDFPDLMPIARRYFAATEADAIERLDPARRPAAFAVTWTRKEATVKAVGLGLRIPLDAFETGDPGRPASLRGHGEPWTRWTLVDFLRHGGYTGAVAIRRPCVAIDVREFAFSCPRSS